MKITDKFSLLKAFKGSDLNISNYQKVPIRTTLKHH